MSAFHDDMAAGYGFTEPTVRLGRPFVDPAAPDTAVEIAIPLRFLNRHGLIAGATGTGKTRTLQLIAEQVSAAGCAVFAADMKGDLAGVGAAGAADDRLTARATELADVWSPAPCPVELLSLTGADGVAIRATVTEFGPTLLSKVLGLNETQESSLGLIFRFCDEKGLALIDLEDLRAALAYLTGPGKAELKTLGGISSSTAGVLLRKVSQLEAEGGDVFFGEPAFDVADLLRTAPDGRGIVSVLDLVNVARQPALFSTFLMWVLAELFECLPEVGDPERPSLVFFFDEAHLLFDDASDSFLDSVAQTVRLIRSKGVGVFFVTQLPTDVPDEVLAQLGHRVQHAVRAFTPKDARALKSAVETFPVTEHYELDRDAPVARRRRGRDHRSRPPRRADAGRRDAPLPAPLAYDAAAPARSGPPPSPPRPCGRATRTASTARAPPSCSRRASPATPRGSRRSAPGRGPSPRRAAPPRSPRRPWPIRCRTSSARASARQVTREVVRGIFGMLRRR